MVSEQISLKISKESKEKLEELTCFKNGYIFI